MKKWPATCFAAAAILLLITLSACGGAGAGTGSERSTATTAAQTTESTSPVTTATEPTIKSTSVLTTTAGTVPEQPDMATFHQYFAELGLGKMPAEVNNPPDDLQKNVAVFTAGDQVCFYGNILQECQPDTALYDVKAEKVVNRGTLLPAPMSGGFANWEPLDLSVGEYEYKIYVADTLVAVFPFEVR
jgi:hypothetical protein